MFNFLMVRCAFKVLAVFVLSANAFAQSFSAELDSEVFMGYPEGNFNGYMKVLSGVVKTGDEAVVYAGTGRKFNIKIVKLSVKVLNETSGTEDFKPINQAKAGERIWVDFFTRDNSGGGSDYLTKGFKVYPKGFAYAPKDKPSSPTSGKKADFHATIDGKPFKASLSYKGALYYRKGVARFQDRSFVQLAFASVDSVDNRNLVFWILEPRESAAVYAENDLEVNFSGAIDGKPENSMIYGFKNGDADTKFTIEITKWKVVSPTKAVVSGKVFGELRKVAIIGRSDAVARFEYGAFDDIEIEVFNERGEFKAISR